MQLENIRTKPSKNSFPWFGIGLSIRYYMYKCLKYVYGTNRECILVKTSNQTLDTVGPDSLETFPGICKRNFLCLQMISFEILREASIG